MKAREGKLEVSPRRYLYIFIAFLIGLPLNSVFVLYVVSEKVYMEPFFLIGVAMWGTLGYFYHEFSIWGKRHRWFMILLGTSLIYIYRIAISTESRNFTMFAGSVSMLFIMAGVRGCYDIFQKKSKKSYKPKIMGRLTVTKRGDDRLWPGGWVYRLRAPIHRIFVRGFGDDRSLLCNTIRALTEGERLVFYCPFEPPKAEPGIFEETIQFAQERQVSYQVFVEKHGRVKQFISGDEDSINSISLDCSIPEMLEWTLEHYWLGDYCCWFLAHDGDFQTWAGETRRVLNPRTFPEGFKELVQASQVFMRDVEEGEALEVVTDKLAREEIEQRISKLHQTADSIKGEQRGAESLPP